MYLLGILFKISNKHSCPFFFFFIWILIWFIWYVALIYLLLGLFLGRKKTPYGQKDRVYYQKLSSFRLLQQHHLSRQVAALQRKTGKLLWWKFRPLVFPQTRICGRNVSFEKENNHCTLGKTFDTEWNNHSKFTCFTCRELLAGSHAGPHILPFNSYLNPSSVSLNRQQLLFSSPRENLIYLLCERRFNLSGQYRELDELCLQ